MDTNKIGETNGFRAMASLRRAAADPRVEEIEGNGCDEGRVFVHLAKGHWFGPSEGTHSATVGSAGELRDRMSRIEPCDCKGCKP